MTRRFTAILPALLLCLLAASDAAANELLVHKEQRRLIFTDGSITREFPITLGFAPTGPKLRQGDGKTPEGIYFITHKNPKSNFHLSLGLSYPNAEDAKKGLRSRLISKREYAAIERAIRQHRMPPQNTGMGGSIYIHGGGAEGNWTLGCIALNDEDMDFLFNHLMEGDKVTILQ